MIVAVIAVRVMQTIVDEIVHVIPMWHKFVPAVGSVLVPSLVSLLGVPGRASIRVLFIDRDLVLVHVVAVGIV